MKAIGCLVPELLSEMHRGCGMQVFVKTQCFYVVTVNCNVSDAIYILHSSRRL